MRKMELLAIVAVSALILAGATGAYIYVTQNKPVKKELVEIPAVYAGNLTFLYWGDYTVTYGNGTPLAKYWHAEYLKTHTWSVERDGIRMVIYPKYITGDYETQAVGLTVMLNSSRYIERVKYISNATEMAIKNGGDINTELVEEEDYEDKREYWRELNLPGDPSVAEIEVWHVGMSNVSFECMDYVNIDMRNTKEPLPYNFTAYIETKDKIYRFDFRFNITAKYYPFIYLRDGWDPYVPNATYYCYIPSEDKVVISDHIVEGTKCFFVEKDGRLSRIVEVRR